MKCDNSLRFFVSLVAIVAPVSGGASWAADSTIPAAQRLRTFSSVAFNREAGDFYGLEMTFVPYNRWHIRSLAHGIGSSAATTSS